MLECFSHANSRERLVDVVERPTEEPRLLAGRHHITALLHEVSEASGVGSVGHDDRFYGALTGLAVEPAVDLRGLGAEVFERREVSPEEVHGPPVPRHIVFYDRGPCRTSDNEFHARGIYWMVDGHAEWRRGYIPLPFVVRLAAQDRPRAVELLDQDEPGNLVRQRHRRQG